MKTIFKKILKELEKLHEKQRVFLLINKKMDEEFYEREKLIKEAKEYDSK